MLKIIISNFGGMKYYVTNTKKKTLRNYINFWMENYKKLKLTNSKRIKFMFNPLVLFCFFLSQIHIGGDNAKLVSY